MFVGRRLVLDGHRVVGLVGPLAEVDGVGAPVEQPGAGVEVPVAAPAAVHVGLVVRPPRRRAEPEVPVDHVARRRRLGRQPGRCRARACRPRRTACGACRACRCGPARTAAWKFGTLRRWVPAWKTRLVSRAWCRPAPGSWRWSGRTASRCRRPCRPSPPGSTPARASGRRWRSARRRCPCGRAVRGSRGRGRSPGCRSARRPASCRPRGGWPARRRWPRTARRAAASMRLEVVGAARADADDAQRDPLGRGRFPVPAERGRGHEPRRRQHRPADRFSSSRRVRLPFVLHDRSLPHRRTGPTWPPVHLTIPLRRRSTPVTCMAAL